MEYNYVCPHCSAFLNTGAYVIFLIETSKSHKKGLLLLDPHLGKYNYVSHPDLKFEEGEKVEFHCPVCHRNLSAKNINQNLVNVKMIDETGKEYELYFSKIAGEHSTFMTQEDHIIEQFGEHNSSYMNYFLSKLGKIKKA